MKKILALISAALIVIAGFAFNGNKQTVKTDDPVLYWFTPAGTYVNRTNSKEDEIPESGCPDEGNIVCEYGYDDNDLNVPGNPAMGLSGSASPNADIRKLQ